MTEGDTERLIAIIEERTRHMVEELQETKREMREVRKETRESIQRVHDRLDEEFVSQRQFGPVEKLVYGGTVLILVAFLGAVMALVVKR